MTAIPDLAFAECNELESAPIPQGATSIGYDAFGNCHKLASITLPAGLTSIQSGAFFGCASLTSIVIPSGVQYIEGKTFSYCTGLKSLTLQEGTTAIYDYAFTGCTLLTTITLPSTLEGICDAAFYGCNSLKSIYALNPQGIGIKGKPFEEYTQSQCTLYVPEGSMYNYKQRQTPDLPHQGPQHCALQRRHHKKGDEIIFQAPTHYLKGAGQCSEYKLQNSLLVPNLRRATSFLCKI